MEGGNPSAPKSNNKKIMDSCVRALDRSFGESKKQRLANSISIDNEEFSDSSDEGGFRSLHLTAEGSTLEELEADGHVWEIDQDGGERKDYPLSSIGGQDYELALGVIRRAFEKELKAEEDGPECTICCTGLHSKCTCLPRADND